jgi:hypothetical protein
MVDMNASVLFDLLRSCSAIRSVLRSEKAQKIGEALQGMVIYK